MAIPGLTSLASAKEFGMPQGGDELVFAVFRSRQSCGRFGPGVGSCPFCADLLCSANQQKVKQQERQQHPTRPQAADPREHRLPFQACENDRSK
jgi:hypothetical protein